MSLIGPIIRAGRGGILRGIAIRGRAARTTRAGRGGRAGRAISAFSAAGRLSAFQRASMFENVARQAYDDAMWLAGNAGQELLLSAIGVPGFEVAAELAYDGMDPDDLFRELLQDEHYDAISEILGEVGQWIWEEVVQ